jgi:hypothetical protein
MGRAGSGGNAMDTVSYVDLERLMGDWHEASDIPSFL